VGEKRLRKRESPDVRAKKGFLLGKTQQQKTEGREEGIQVRGESKKKRGNCRKEVRRPSEGRTPWQRSTWGRRGEVAPRRGGALGVPFRDMTSILWLKAWENSEKIGITL